MGGKIILTSGVPLVNEEPYQGIYTLDDATEIEPTTEEWLKDNPFLPLENSFAELTCAVRVAADAMAHILGITRTVLAMCPDRRVAHLALHGKKRRTRKKNLHRAFRILEKEA